MGGRTIVMDVDVGVKAEGLCGGFGCVSGGVGSSLSVSSRISQRRCARSQRG